MPPEVDLLRVLRQNWGYSSFRPLQERIVHSLLDGRDACVVMPTGGGKSLCYQLPALVLGKTAVVISPLIALMHDQTAQLEQMGVPAAVLNSSLTAAEQSRIVQKARAGEYRLLYLSPERLAREDTVGWLRGVPVSFFAIDEAHCISGVGTRIPPGLPSVEPAADTISRCSDCSFHCERHPARAPRYLAAAATSPS